jgi:hypothetical protein
VNVGDRVRITGDSFRGEEGVIRELRDHGAAGIRLDIHEEGLYHADAGKYELVKEDSGQQELDSD